MQGELDKLNKTLSSIKAIYDYAQRLERRMDKSIKAKYDVREYSGTM